LDPDAWEIDFQMSEVDCEIAAYAMSAVSRVALVALEPGLAIALACLATMPVPTEAAARESVRDLAVGVATGMDRRVAAVCWRAWG
jgi:hypothetical protein